MTGQLVELSLDSLHRPKVAVRYVRIASDMAALRASIERVGLQKPIIVRPRFEGGYEVVDGWSRVTCLKDMGTGTIQGIARRLSDEEAIDVADQANRNQRPPHFLDDALLCFWLRSHDPGKWPVNALATRFRTGDRTVKSWLQVVKHLDQETIEAAVRIAELGPRPLGHGAPISVKSISHKSPGRPPGPPAPGRFWALNFKMLKWVSKLETPFQERDVLTAAAARRLEAGHVASMVRWVLREGSIADWEPEAGRRPRGRPPGNGRPEAKPVPAGSDGIAAALQLPEGACATVEDWGIPGPELATWSRSMLAIHGHLTRGLSPEQAAEAMGVSAADVRTRLETLRSALCSIRGVPSP